MPLWQPQVTDTVPLSLASDPILLRQPQVTGTAPLSLASDPILLWHPHVTGTVPLSLASDPMLTRCLFGSHGSQVLFPIHSKLTLCSSVSQRGYFLLPSPTQQPFLDICFPFGDLTILLLQYMCLIICKLFASGILGVRLRSVTGLPREAQTK